MHPRTFGTNSQGRDPTTPEINSQGGAPSTPSPMSQTGETEESCIPKEDCKRKEKKEEEVNVSGRGGVMQRGGRKESVRKRREPKSP